MDKLSSKSSELYIFWVLLLFNVAKLQSNVLSLPIKKYRNNKIKAINLEFKKVKKYTKSNQSSSIRFFYEIKIFKPIEKLRGKQTISK
jgi:hypothetical protein